MNEEHSEFKWVERFKITKGYIITMFLVPMLLYIILCLMKILEFSPMPLYIIFFYSTSIITMTFLSIKRGYGVQYYNIKLFENHLSIEVSNRLNYNVSDLRIVENIYHGLFVQSINCKMELKYAEINNISENEHKKFILIESDNGEVSNIKVKTIDSDLKIRILRALGERVRAM